MDLLVGGIVVGFGLGVVVVDEPGETVGFVCSLGPECLETGHSFDVGWAVCAENGLHGEAEARLVESVYFG